MGRRHLLLVGTFLLLIMLLYVDRVVISAAKEWITDELLLSGTSIECLDPNISTLER